VTRLTGVGRVTFAALAIPNYRRYIAGQSVSLVGTWMQMAAQSWLVLTLTNSATTLGVIVALQTLPVLLLGPYGGVIADRVDKRRLMVVLQMAMGVQALVLGVLTITGAVRLWEIGALALLLGVNNAFESPARQSFILEMVGPESLRNAVSLNSVLVNVARVIGPAVAGILIATVGEGLCFLLNAASFVAVVASLSTLDRGAISPSPPSGREPGQLREGLRYVRRTPELGVPLLMMALVGALAYEFQVTLPVMASQGLHVGARGFGFMTSAMGVGAVIGGLFVAARGRTGLPTLVASATAFGLLLLLASAASSLPVELVALALVGGASISFMSTGNSTLQLTAAPSMRGRVMSLWFVAFQGSTPIGGPLIGWVMANAGARAGMGVGGVSCLAVALLGLLALRRRGRQLTAARRCRCDHVQSYVMTDTAIEVFDRHAGDYEALRRRLVPRFDDLYCTAVEALGLVGRPLRRVLDLGAGTGLMTRAVAQAHADSELVLLDGSSAMLEQARDSLGDRASYVTGALQEALPPGPWDAVVSALAIHHLEDPDKRDLFGRIQQELSPGGVFVNAEQVKAPTAVLDHAYAAWHERRARELGASAQEWSQACERMRSDRLATVEDQLAWLRAAGFADVDCLFKDHCFALLFARA
jgi:MFS family permease/ubiquinone/menaquinone biosynthesis C-methylase UbiE